MDGSEEKTSFLKDKFGYNNNREGILMSNVR